jgi:RND family efflux transporter MFP subunit
LTIMPRSTPRPRTPRDRPAAALADGALAACLAAGLGFWLAGCDGAAPRAAGEPPPAVAVGEVAPAGPSARRDDDAGWVGVLLPRRSVDVAVDSTGEVTAVTAQVGDRVRRGDPLARIDTEPVRQALAVAEASLAAQRAEASRARVELAEARARLARREALPESFSREDLGAAELDQETAAAALEAALARVTEQEARVASLMREVNRTEVRAPFDGTVALRLVDTGDLVRPGLPIVRLISSDELLLRFAVPPDAARGLAPGLSVTATLEPSGLQLEATVRDVAPEVDAAALMVFVEATVSVEAAASQGAQAGMVARVRPALPASGA